ncbi:hypothetical protein A4U53_010905 [Rhizobium ruizarguesonis]|uniref:Uncharacterized protein n=2 Tax=Rhizobium TaxID=379 RepID=A0A179BZ02_RHILE|nr:hypothetical protein [Rhizobium leguminosarum]OAP96886.1 hypothetical protein A4U53_11920 [Rhizobium leguminosarum]
MRKFASIPPRVWQADLKAVRGNLEALAVHYHLTTSGHANMLGLYYVPVTYIAHEIGCPEEGASKGLLALVEAKICSYDFDRELVWVHEMAADQIAAQLSPKDKRVKGVADQLAMLPICPITLSFYQRYRLSFHLYDERNLEEFELSMPENAEAPSKALRSKEKEKEKDKDLGKGEGPSGSRGSGKPTGTSDTMFTPYPIPKSSAEAKTFLLSKGVPADQIDACLRNLLGGNLTPYDLEGVLTDARSAA